MRRHLVVLSLAAALVAASCSSNEASLTPLDAPGGGGSGSSEPEIGSELCVRIDGDEITEDVVDDLPEEYREAAELIASVADAMSVSISTEDPEGSTGPEVATQLLESLTDEKMAGELKALATAIERDCGTEADMILGLARASELGAAPVDTEYCAVLAPLMDSQTDSSPAEGLAAALAVAPPAHREALESLEAMSAEGSVNSEALSEQFGALVGLGLYSEAKCGVEGAFAAMFFAAAFMSLGEDVFGPDDILIGGGSGGTTPAGDPDADPPPAGASAATALIPPGSSLSFEVVQIALEDDGTYKASVVKPVGWPEGGFGFGVSYEPDGDDFGFFTEIDFDKGCDGICQRKDWEAALTSDTGYLTQYRSTRTFTVDRSVEGSEGLALMGPNTFDGIDGLVLRWNDGADYYLSCSFTLDEDDVAYADAFLAACEASRPGWFDVG